MGRGTVLAVSIMGHMSVLVVGIVMHISLDRGCTGRLGRAANANNIAIATQELDAAIAYMEKHDLTKGYTSILWQTPNEDIGYWYQNIKASRDELRKFPPDATHLEVSNQLMKLRETLTDKDEVNYPDGLSRYPFNAFIGFVFWVSGLLTLILGVPYLDSTTRHRHR